MIVQKSLAEGFGLTVAEGMWKGRPVIGSAVGGILDEIADGTGILLPDPADLAVFGSQVRHLLDSHDDAECMGKAGQERIREHFVGDRHLLLMGTADRRDHWRLVGQPGPSSPTQAPSLSSGLRTTVRAHETATDDLTRQPGVASPASTREPRRGIPSRTNPYPGRAGVRGAGGVAEQQPVHRSPVLAEPAGP